VSQRQAAAEDPPAAEEHATGPQPTEVLHPSDADGDRPAAEERAPEPQPTEILSPPDKP
jgi:hypothetical protein